MYAHGGGPGSGRTGNGTRGVQGCQAVDRDTGDVCGETGTLKILDEFRNLYETRIKKIDEEECGDGDRLKLTIMEEWVKDLGEQNAMLVRTVEELEREAANRVNLLEEKLRTTSTLVADCMSHSNQSDETLNILTTRVSQLEKDEESLQQKIEFLQSDIRGLLELIRRARRENCWSLDGITFFEIQPSDIPPPLDCTCGQDDLGSLEQCTQQLMQLKENEKKALAYQAELEGKLADLNKQVNLKEETIRKYISKLQNLRDNLKKRSKLANQVILGSTTPSADLDSDIVTMTDIMEKALDTKELEVEGLRHQLQDSEIKLNKLMHEKSLEMDEMQNQLDQKCMELQQIEYRMACLQKESLETREALTAEVAEKHDLVLSLRKDVAALEEQCRQSDMQTHFKDDIIKEMRRELKQAKSKDTCSSSRKVRIKTETSLESDGTSMRERLHEAQNQLKTIKCMLAQKTDELGKVKKEFNCHKIQTAELCRIVEKLRTNKSSKKEEDEILSGKATSGEQDEILMYLCNTKALMEKERGALVDLKSELQRVLEEMSTKDNEVSERDSSIANVQAKLRDIGTMLNNYKTQVIDHNKSMEDMKSNMEATETKLSSLQETLQNSTCDSNNTNNATLQCIETLLANCCKIKEETCCGESNTLLTSLDRILKKVKSILELVEKCTCEENGTRHKIMDISKRLCESIDGICRISKDKEKAIALIECMIKKCKEARSSDNCDRTLIKKCKEFHLSDVRDTFGNANEDKMNREVLHQQFRIMEEFRVCTVEAQAATEDLREEMSSVIATLNCRHEKFTELSKMVKHIQEQLTKTRENICDTVNLLKLQEEEKSRHSERIASGETKLKDMKNEINQMRSELSQCINSAQESMQACSPMGLVKIHTCNDLFNMVTDEVEQIVSNLQIYQSQASNGAALLMVLKEDLNTMACSLKDLQKKVDEVLLENEMAQKTFCERSNKLDRLEQELDCTHTRMQEMLENFNSPKEQIPNPSHSPKSKPKKGPDEILRVKDELRRVQKEYEDMKIRVSQDFSQSQKQEKIDEWKCRVTDLQDKVRALQNETKCESAANDFLRRSIESMEKEISSTQMKSQAYRRCHTSDSAELKSKIFGLECAAKKHKDIEDSLRRSLESSEIELKKSKELLGSFKSDSKSEGVYSRSGQDTKHENIPQSFKILQETMHSARSGLQDLGNELKKLIGEGSSHSCSSMGSMMAALDMLRKYGENTEQCAAEVEKLRNTLCSKDKLLENKDEIIRIQKDSIKMTQAELKDLHSKLQEKEQCKEKVLRDFQLTQAEIEEQAHTIAELEKDRRHLEKESELQVQTIGNLQEAVVEAKRRLDQMGNRAASELNDKDEVIHLLNIYLSETRSQYNRCFAEAAKQDTTLELQRDAIDQLRQELDYMERNKYTVSNCLHSMYYNVLCSIQEQLQTGVKDFDSLKCKMDALVKSKNCLEDKYANVKRLWQEADQELQELKLLMCKKDNEIKCCQTEITKCKDQECAAKELLNKLTTRDCSSSTKAQQLEKKLQDYATQTKDLEAMLEKSNSVEDELRNEIQMLLEQERDMRRQLQKYKMDFEIFDKELKAERQNNIDAQELEDQLNELKRELGNHTRQTEFLVNDLQLSKEREACLEKQLVRTETEQREHIDSIVVRDELQKRNRELAKLTAEAIGKEEELKILQELRKEFERTEDLGNLNECLKKDLEIVQLENKNTELKLKKCIETVGRLHDDVEIKNEEIKSLCSQIDSFKEKSQSNEQQTEEYLTELNSSKEMLGVLRDRVCSLKGLLKEKSDGMAKLQADFQIVKNANSILKAEHGIFESKAREDVGDLKKRLKELQFQLCLMEDNYQRVTQDFKKSQELLIDAAKREVELQHAITTTEQNLFSKLATAEREEIRLGDIVDKLSEELEDARDELSCKSAKLCQVQCRCKCYVSQLETVQQDCREQRGNVECLQDTINQLERKLEEGQCMIHCKECENMHLKTQIENITTCQQHIGDGKNKKLSSELSKMRSELKTQLCREAELKFEVQSLQDKLSKAEVTNCCLTQQLQQCEIENCELSKEKNLLEQNNCKFASELEDMHKSLLELRKECQLKTKSLVSISAELSQVAVSRTELCNESQYVVSCIRSWMDEQRRLVETLASKLNVKQQQMIQLAFEKKALLATVKELKRTNCGLTQKVKRLQRCSGGGGGGRGTKSMYTGCRTSPPCVPYCSNVRFGSNTSYSRATKKCSVGPIRNARRTSVCGNSWWFPKMEHLTKELRKNNQWWDKNVNDQAESDPGLDESRDCGYQSSTSK